MIGRSQHSLGEVAVRITWKATYVLEIDGDARRTIQRGALPSDWGMEFVPEWDGQFHTSRIGHGQDLKVVTVYVDGVQTGNYRTADGSQISLYMFLCSYVTGKITNGAEVWDWRDKLREHMQAAGRLYAVTHDCVDAHFDMAIHVDIVRKRASLSAEMSPIRAGSP